MGAAAVGVILIMGLLVIGAYYGYTQGLPKATQPAHVIMDTTFHPPVDNPSTSPTITSSKPVASVTSPSINRTVYAIATWNLQIFGRSEAGDPAKLARIAEAIQQYDIVAMQEVRDSSGLAAKALCDNLKGYSCLLGERVGYTTMKEQYLIAYKDGIRLVGHNDNLDLQSQYSRPPLFASFEVNGWSFTLVDIHTVPEDTPKELDQLDDLVGKLKGDIIVVGDMNADCSYYMPEFEPDFSGWDWVVPDTADTNVASSSCAYDRIIINRDMDTDWGWENIEGISDHYLVWATITPA